jgi:hypothetical protein
VLKSSKSTIARTCLRCWWSVLRSYGFFPCGFGQRLPCWTGASSKTGRTGQPWSRLVGSRLRESSQMGAEEVRVQIHSACFSAICFSAIYLASVRGSLCKRRFQSVLLNDWLTFAALRIFSLAASHPQDATVLSLTSFPSATLRGSPPGNSLQVLRSNPATLSFSDQPLRLASTAIFAR